MNPQGPITGESLTIWQAIWRAMDERGLSRADVAKMVTGEITRPMVYKYLDGTNDLSSDRASVLLDRLGLGVQKVKPARPDDR